MGNTFVSQQGIQEDYTLVDSHLDTVADGGRYDGTLVLYEFMKGGKTDK